MKTILVSKTGTGRLYMPDAIEQQGPMTEQGATAGLLKRLGEKYRVLYVGLVSGTLPPGCVHVDPDLRGVDEFCTVERQRDFVGKCLERVRPYGPVAFVNMQGGSPTWHRLDNEEGCSVMAQHCRYTSPAAMTATELKLPRIVLTADVRCYPRDGEMKYHEPMVPRALFSQITRTWAKPRVVQGTRWAIREVECGMENWHTYGRELPDPPPEGRHCPMTCLSHAHIGSGFGTFLGRIARGREEAWRRTFLEPLDVRPELKRLECSVIGEGWEHFSGYDPELFVGPCRPADVMSVVQQSVTSPVVTPWGDDPYVTSKVRYLAWGGCVPLMYGRGEWTPHMGDGVGRYVDLRDSTLRYADSREFIELVHHWDSFRLDAAERARQIEELTRPQFARLEQCIEDTAAGRDWTTDSWWEEYGGYRRVQ